MAGGIILTIGRQYGSGGREIGRKIAEKRGMAFYDKELLTLAAKESGMSEDIFEHYDETPASSLLYSLSMSASALGAGSVYANVPLHHQVFLAQFDAIRKAAQQGPCVIVGRCADYALAEDPRRLSVFIHAPAQVRLERVCTLYGLSRREAETAMAKTDMADLAYVPASAALLKGAFPVEVKTRGITAQQKSGRCWLFIVAGQSRPKLTRQ